MSKTQEYINYLNEQIGIAPANSQEELQAAQTIADVMEDHGVEPAIEEFDTHTGEQAAKPVIVILMLLALILTGFGGIVGYAAVAVDVICVVLLGMDHAGKDVIARMGPVARSQNIVGFHEHTGDKVVKGNRPIVIVAHYDTAHVNPLRENAALAPLLPRARKAAIYCVYAAGIAAVVQLLGFVPDVPRRIVWFLGILAGLLPLVLAIGDIATRFSDCTDGANDNKSGVAALLSILANVRPGPDRALDAEALKAEQAAQAAERERARAEREQQEAEAAAAAAEAKAKAEAERLAKYKRHGEQTVRALGMVPQDCPIVYEDAPTVPVPSQGDEQPATKDSIEGSADEATDAEAAPAEQEEPADAVERTAKRPLLGSLFSRKKETKEETAPEPDAGEPTEDNASEEAPLSEADDSPAVRGDTDSEGDVALQGVESDEVTADDEPVPATDKTERYEVPADNPYMQDSEDGQAELWPGVMDAEWEQIQEPGVPDITYGQNQDELATEDTESAVDDEGAADDDEPTDGAADGETTPTEDDGEPVDVEDTSDSDADEVSVDEVASDEDETEEAQSDGDDPAGPDEFLAGEIKDVGSYVDSIFAEEITAAEGIEPAAEEPNAPQDDDENYVAEVEVTTTDDESPDDSPIEVPDEDVEVEDDDTDELDDGDTSDQAMASAESVDQADEQPSAKGSGAEEPTSWKQPTPRIPDDKFTALDASFEQISELQDEKSVTAQDGVVEPAEDHAAPVEAEATEAVVDAKPDASKSDDNADQTLTMKPIRVDAEIPDAATTSDEDVQDEPAADTSAVPSASADSATDLDEPDDPDRTSPSETASVDYASPDFQLDANVDEPQDEDVAPKDESGLEEEVPLDATMPVADRPKPPAPDDPNWGKSEFQPSVTNVARRVSLYDLPDPSGASIDSLGTESGDGAAENAASSAEDGTAAATNAPTTQGTGEMPSVGSQEQLDVITPESLDRIAEETKRRHHHHHGWKGGATPKDELRLPHFDLSEPAPEVDGHELGGDTSVSDGDATPVANPVPTDQPQTVSEEELRDAVLSMSDDELISHDIWFVATGASYLDHAGIKAFLDAHRKDIRGAFLINIDCVGDGTLAVLTSEGEKQRRRADRRLVRMFTTTGQDLDIEPARVRYEHDDTDATPALRSHVRAVTLMGIDEDGMPIHAQTSDDIAEHVDGGKVAHLVELVTEVIRRS